MNQEDCDVLEELGVIECTHRVDKSAVYRLTGIGVSLCGPEHRLPPQLPNVFIRLGKELYVNEEELSVDHLKTLEQLKLVEVEKKRGSERRYKLTAMGIALLANRLERDE